MCLAIPGRVISVTGNMALVEFCGIRRGTRLDMLDQPVAPGDYLLTHLGLATCRIPTEQIEETLVLYDMLLEAASGGMTDL